MMHYINNKTKEIVELIYSDNEFCLYVPQVEIDSTEGELNGNIFYGNKDKFKKTFKKYKKEATLLETELKDSIISTFLFDKKRLRDDKKADELIVLTQHLYNKEH